MITLHLACRLGERKRRQQLHDDALTYIIILEHGVDKVFSAAVVIVVVIVAAESCCTDSAIYITRVDRFQQQID